ncbi:MAG: SRPBCC family protein [Verrucomicrobia bacterium]|nr:SRPBCC family protein [Verrucomicrobiota bacterium]
MLKKILLGLAVIVAAILVLAAFQPSTYRVERSVTLAAPPAVPFASVNAFKQWLPWSPWEKKDPAMKRTFSGPDAGVGAVYAWEGNSEVGSGRMAILESRPAELIRIKLEFFTPMEGLSEAVFAFKPEGDRTKVTWTMTGANNYVGKLFCLFMNMDKMVGGDFEQGLASLKTVSESPAKK